jgi:hypothetical protein
MHGILSSKYLKHFLPSFIPSFFLSSLSLFFFTLIYPNIGKIYLYQDVKTSGRTDNPWFWGMGNYSLITVSGEQVSTLPFAQLCCVKLFHLLSLR